MNRFRLRTRRDCRLLSVVGRQRMHERHKLVIGVLREAKGSQAMLRARWSDRTKSCLTPDGAKRERAS